MNKIKKMRAIVCSEWCKPEDLKISEIKTPTLDDQSVRVQVHAAGVNFPDVLIVQGKYQYKPSFPFSPGSEVSGVISEIGKNIKDLKVGDRIMAITGHGAFAEEVCVSENKILLRYLAKTDASFLLKVSFLLCLIPATKVNLLLLLK